LRLLGSETLGIVDSMGGGGCVESVTQGAHGFLLRVCVSLQLLPVTVTVTAFCNSDMNLLPSA
jgi:hypothetical protein